MLDLTMLGGLLGGGVEPAVVTRAPLGVGELSLRKNPDAKRLQAQAQARQLAQLMLLMQSQAQAVPTGGVDEIQGMANVPIGR